jgi:ketosteroid isomerase-like protein
LYCKVSQEWINFLTFSQTLKMNRIVLFAMLPGLFFCISACTEKAESEKKFNLDTAKAEILALTAQFTEAHLEKDTAFLNNIFTSDARIYPPNAPMTQGKKDIAQLNYDWVNYGIYEFVEVSRNCYGSEECLVDEGSYFLRYGDEQIRETGDYINIWKKVRGEWKIYSNIWNASPAAQPESALLDFANGYTEAWNSGLPENMASFYAEDGILVVNGGTPSVGRKELAATSGSYMEAFPDLKLTFDSLVPDGKTFRYYWTFAGTNTGPGGTGNPVLFSGFEQWTMNAEGLIQRSIGTYDAEEYQRQLAEGL